MLMTSDGRLHIYKFLQQTGFLGHFFGEWNQRVQVLDHNVFTFV